MSTAENEPPFTPEGTIGPFFPFFFTERPPGNPATDMSGLTHRPAGDPILVGGRVLDEAEKPVRNMILEFWQANAFGRYRHPLDRDAARPLDPAFDGFARLRTDADGRYRLRTIKPGARPAAADPNVLRAPHLRVTIFGSGIDRIVTSIFFDGEALNDGDPLLQSLGDSELASRLIARRAMEPTTDGVAIYEFDFVLRGARETPFFDDWSR